MLMIKGKFTPMWAIVHKHIGTSFPESCLQVVLGVLTQVVSPERHYGKFKQIGLAGVATL